ncbi:hypothetical protein LEP48_05530 [Isoptericola sp. NEAU-Y5]|uniref:Secreted protein n=1 Tax=Isoptericola luteus TaxID=2879484 RepID=A0ABS7ZCQ5_9MICO|nr:hypothetical protein [Isoptericola sp. NEAU-Y5]MCA5892815.1 hypothetical protein [Isoptericola sp. NEAU-Y5]
MSLASVVGSLPAWAVLAAGTTPSPSPSQGPSELEVTPGLEGFVATFAVAVACVLLFLSLTRHLRRATRNAEDLGLPVTEPRRVGSGRRSDSSQAPGGPAVPGGPDADGRDGDGSGPGEPDDGDRR